MLISEIVGVSLFLFPCIEFFFIMRHSSIRGMFRLYAAPKGVAESKSKFFGINTTHRDGDFLQNWKA